MPVGVSGAFLRVYYTSFPESKGSTLLIQTKEKVHKSMQLGTGEILGSYLSQKVHEWRTF